MPVSIGTARISADGIPCSPPLRSLPSPVRTRDAWRNVRTRPDKPDLRRGEDDERQDVLAKGVAIGAKAYRLLRAVMTTAVKEDKILPRNPCRARGADKVITDRSDAAGFSTGRRGCPGWPICAIPEYASSPLRRALNVSCQQGLSSGPKAVTGNLARPGRPDRGSA